MRTLQGWATKNNVVITKHCHARCLRADAPNQSDLFRLDDYYVSSIVAGTIWMVRRNLFESSYEKNTRSNIRNSCVGLSMLQLHSYMQSREGFERDCIEEFMMELKVEEQMNLSE